MIELNDPALIAEVRGYTSNDLMNREADPRLTTRHFDLLMALCIAYQTNTFVKKPTSEEDESSFSFLRNMTKKVVKNRAR